MAFANVSQDVTAINQNKITVETIQIIKKAAELILHCDAILFTSGAGMGLPLLQHPELDFTKMSTPRWFRKDQGNSDKHDMANFGYAFWAFRYSAYTSATLHLGYSIAKKWSKLSQVKWSFSFTSNIDGHWIKSGWKDRQSLNVMVPLTICNASAGVVIGYGLQITR
ncbi:unnamed protein product [Didymodactylos carnosus]|uniref:Deacetylase sirtuin-type domain-containing protein n=1 Tax=Didymodactylos carnosus TaxID=1234261 RepID=A0A815JR66_9BILA|nr:unnamed protein product [Didymodactylos carnosus]CAF1529985.1 unnamed protein product [Didymodactylos carnosus]CAF4280667.1 unnamed protein product [Didymodactylos carnosus]CAF4316954.1 unnamed protein product [Didymodactylos carnosus]